MKKILVAFGLAVCIPAANAAEWVQVAGGSKATYFLDKNSIRNSGSSEKKAWVLAKYVEEQYLESNKTAYGSAKSLRVYSCSEATVTLKSVAYYSNTDGTGALVESIQTDREKPQDIVPDTIGEAVWKAVCFKN